MELENFERQVVIDLIGAVNHPLKCLPTRLIGLENSNFASSEVQFRDFDQNLELFLGFPRNPDVIFRMEMERSMSLLQVLVWYPLLCDYLGAFFPFVGGGVGWGESKSNQQGEKFR